MKNYALVYLVDDDPTNELKDIGNDPDFSSPPTWGICRPNIRNQKEIKAGSILLFIAGVKTGGQKKYFIKGFFTVAEKIDIVEAISRFGKRLNVIISTKKRMNENKDWRNKKWECLIKSKEIPEFIKSVNQSGANYYQKDDDKHHVDNWKCRRIYNCNIYSFKKCVEKNQCLKENDKENKYPLKRNYIVGATDNYKDWNSLRIEWKEVAALIGKKTELMVANKHPEVTLTNSEFELIKEYMNKKEIEQKSC